MTREEAIGFGERVIALGLKDETQTFCELAIEALKVEPNEDCVSREAVKKLYCNICMDKNICYRNKENCGELNLFDKLPPVTPKQIKLDGMLEDAYEHGYQQARYDYDDVLDEIKHVIKDNTYFINEITEKEGIDFETVEKIIDKYKAESEE